MYWQEDWTISSLWTEEILYSYIVCYHTEQSMLSDIHAVSLSGERQVYLFMLISSCPGKIIWNSVPDRYFSNLFWKCFIKELTKMKVKRAQYQFHFVRLIRKRFLLWILRHTKVFVVCITLYSWFHKIVYVYASTLKLNI